VSVRRLTISDELLDLAAPPAQPARDVAHSHPAAQVRPQLQMLGRGPRVDSRPPAARLSGAPSPGSIASVTAEATETTGPGESRARYMLIFRGGAVSRDDVSPSVLQAHVEKWYRWSDELARQGRRNVGTALDNGGKSVGGHERIVTDGPYAESKDLVTGAMIIEAASLEDAVDVAQQCPTYEFGGSVEVRPVQGEGG
jgi:hypothetical protein